MLRALGRSVVSKIKARLSTPADFSVPTPPTPLRAPPGF